MGMLVCVWFCCSPKNNLKKKINKKVSKIENKQSLNIMTPTRDGWMDG
jgi:hypothetical protein